MKLENCLRQILYFSERVNGKFSLRRNFEINKGNKVLIIEDVITTGKSILECEELVKKYQGLTIGFACIIDRSNNNFKTEKKIVSQVKLDIPTFKPDNLQKRFIPDQTNKAW